MVFQSYSFILVFLPLLLLSWHTLLNGGRLRAAWGVLLGFSIIYYALYDYKLIAVLFLAALCAYLASFAMVRAPSRTRTWGSIACAVQLILLLYVKCVAAPVFVTIGVSFFTLRFISFILDRARGELGHPGDPLLFATYAAFFPVLSQGPIVRYKELEDELSAPDPSKERMKEGLILFVFGLSKKVLLANALSPVVESGFYNAAYLDLLTVLFVMVSYAFELYLDFSGYCDMAMGVSMLLGLSLPANFNAPYLATSVREFWRGWHMTLVSFFTRYVYIPLGGSGKGSARQCANIMTVFVLSALWHGFGITYLIWGLIEGLKVVVSHLLRKGGVKLPDICGWALTFFSFLFSLIFFRAKDLGEALTMAGALLHLRYPGFLYRVAGSLSFTETYLPFEAAKRLAPFTVDKNVYLFACWCLLLLICILLIRKGNAYGIAKRLSSDERLPVYITLLLALLFVSALTSLSGVRTFLYFRY